MKKKTSQSKRKRTTPSLGVYLDDDIERRFTLGIMKEKEKQILKGEKPTISKSGITSQLIEGWLKKNHY